MHWRRRNPDFTDPVAGRDVHPQFERRAVVAWLLAHDKIEVPTGPTIALLVLAGAHGATHRFRLDDPWLDLADDAAGEDCLSGWSTDEDADALALATGRVGATVSRLTAPGAGPLADTLRFGQLDQGALDWLQTNFYKTELELGRCLRLPQEGPCECDLYLTCAKFVTTPQYAPRLRERLRVEGQLVADAEARGWDREIQRHQRIADRVTSLLDDLGEPHDEPTD